MSHYLLCQNCGEKVALVSDLPRSGPGVTARRNQLQKVIRGYLKARTVSDSEARIASDVLLSDFRQWVREKAPAGTQISPKAFGTAIRDCGIEPYRSSGRRYYTGLRLAT